MKIEKSSDKLSEYSLLKLRGRTIIKYKYESKKLLKRNSKTLKINSKMTQSQSSQFNLSDAIKLIPEYDGSDEPSQFIKAVDFLRASVDVSLYSKILNIAILRLKGQAYNAIKHRNITSWSEGLKPILEEKFGTQKTLSHLARELQALKINQGESVEKYGERCTEILAQYNDACIKEQNISDLNVSVKNGILANNEFLALDNFISGLKPPLKTFVKCCRHKKLADAILDAKAEEAKLEAEKAKFPKTCTFCKISGHSVEQCRKKAAQSKQNKPFCNYCKKSGHTITDCRKRPQNQNSQNSSSQNTNTQNSNSQNSQNRPFCGYCRITGHHISRCFRRPNNNTQHPNQNRDNNGNNNQNNSRNNSSNSNNSRRNNTGHVNIVTAENQGNAQAGTSSAST